MKTRKYCIAFTFYATPSEAADMTVGVMSEKERAALDKGELEIFIVETDTTIPLKDYMALQASEKVTVKPQKFSLLKDSIIWGQS